MTDDLSHAVLMDNAVMITIRERKPKKKKKKWECEESGGMDVKDRLG